MFIQQAGIDPPGRMSLFSEPFPVFIEPIVQ
jgi:hypothetical protein